MKREGTIVRYTNEELEEMQRRGEGRTNWDKVRAMTDEEIEAAVDYEEEGYPDWSTLSTELPGPKVSFQMFLDEAVFEWFEAQGDGYKTRMNDILKSYVADQSKKTA